MIKLIPVEGNSSLARDSQTGAIVNINTQEISEARDRKALKQKEKLRMLKLENDVADIKEMLTKLFERL
jgi:hypothetical protein